MNRTADQAGGQNLARFLTELAACLDDADAHTAQAFAEHYGFEEAIDWSSSCSKPTPTR